MKSTQSYIYHIFIYTVNIYKYKYIRLLYISYLSYTLSFTIYENALPVIAQYYCVLLVLCPKHN